MNMKKRFLYLIPLMYFKHIFWTSFSKINQKPMNNDEKFCVVLDADMEEMTLVIWGMGIWKKI